MILVKDTYFFIVAVFDDKVVKRSHRTYLRQLIIDGKI